MKFLFDIAPLLLFFAAFKFYDIYAATAVAIAASFAQVGYFWFRHHRVETMHVVTLAVIAVFGGLTLLLSALALLVVGRIAWVAYELDLSSSLALVTTLLALALAAAGILGGLWRAAWARGASVPSVSMSMRRRLKSVRSPTRIFYTS